jgi:8-oxo-dGTP diphosphatase
VGISRGKLEIGESVEGCLIREIKEELDIDIKIVKPLKENIHQYADFGLKLIPFECAFTEGKIKLAEHAQYLWLYPKELGKLDWADADRPILEEILA